MSRRGHDHLADQALADPLTALAGQDIQMSDSPDAGDGEHKDRRSDRKRRRDWPRHCRQEGLARPIEPVRPRMPIVDQPLDETGTPSVRSLDQLSQPI